MMVFSPFHEKKYKNQKPNDNQLLVFALFEIWTLSF